jgi:hypothetical protein
MTDTPEAKPEYKPNLAVYSTYCGTLENLTFCARSYDNYPAYFITNNAEVLPIAEAHGWIPLLMTGMEPSNDPIVSATQAKVAKALPHRFDVLVNTIFCFTPTTNTNWRKAYSLVWPHPCAPTTRQSP